MAGSDLEREREREREHVCIHISVYGISTHNFMHMEMQCPAYSRVDVCTKEIPKH